jgi:hypothetical protein
MSAKVFKPKSAKYYIKRAAGMAQFGYNIYPGESDSYLRETAVLSYLNLQRLWDRDTEGLDGHRCQLPGCKEMSKSWAELVVFPRYPLRLFGRDEWYNPLYYGLMCKKHAKQLADWWDVE